MKSERNYEQELAMENRGFVTIQVAAKRVGRRESTLYRWAKRKLVEGTKVGPKQYLSVTSLLTYLGEEGAKLYQEAAARESLEA